MKKGRMLLIGLLILSCLLTGCKKSSQEQLHENFIQNNKEGKQAADGVSIVSLKHSSEYQARTWFSFVKPVALALAYLSFMTGYILKTEIKNNTVLKKHMTKTLMAGVPVLLIALTATLAIFIKTTEGNTKGLYEIGSAIEKSVEQMNLPPQSNSFLDLQKETATLSETFFIGAYTFLRRNVMLVVMASLVMGLIIRAIVKDSKKIRKHMTIFFIILVPTVTVILFYASAFYMNLYQRG